MKELWKDITEYEGFYQVSNLGRIKSVERTVIDKRGVKQSFKEKILKPVFNHGYHRVTLTKNGECRIVRIHRIVAQEFLGFHDELIVNHIDEDKTNNAVSNLEWCTPKENYHHSVEKQREKSKKLNKKILATKPNGEEILFNSVGECCLEVGISEKSMSSYYGRILKRGKLKGWFFEKVE